MICLRHQPSRVVFESLQRALIQAGSSGPIAIYAEPVGQSICEARLRYRA